MMDLEPIEERANEFATWVGKFDSAHRIPAAFDSAADVPALLAEVKRLRAEVADLRATVSSVWDEGIARCCTGDASQDDGHHKSCRYVHGDLRPDPDDREALADAEAKVERQRDRLRAREEQARRLRVEVTRLATRPAWDEEAVAEAVRKDLEAAGILPWTNGGARIVRTALAVVRDHLPVKPDREGALKRAYRDRQSPIQEEDAWAFGEGVRAGIDATLDLLPGRSEAEVKAEAWDEGYDYATNGKWGPGENPYREGGADRG